MQEGQAIETEIREREKQRSPVEEREAELRDFLENAVVPIHWVAGDGTILWANNAELELLYAFCCDTISSTFCVCPVIGGMSAL